MSYKTSFSRKSFAGYEATVQTICHFFRTSQKTGPLAQEKHENKKEETTNLIQFAQQNDWFYEKINYQDFISEGAEQKVFFKNEFEVLKNNESIYYASWEDYFLNILLHNYFFSDTAYTFLGFYLHQKTLFSVVSQKYIKAEQLTDILNIKKFMGYNGFQVKKIMIIFNLNWESLLKIYMKKMY